MGDHIYQVCGVRGDKYFDGIVHATQKVLNHEQYIEIKKDIGEQMGVDPKNVTIISFSYLGVK